MRTPRLWSSRSAAMARGAPGAVVVAQRGHGARVDPPAVLEEDLLVAHVRRLAGHDGRGRQADDAAGALVDRDGDAVGVEDDDALLQRGHHGAIELAGGA